MSSEKNPKNPGPPWGFRVIHFWNQVLPGPLRRWVCDTAAWIAMLSMPKQRMYSQQYMSAILKRPAGFRDCARQFKAFVIYLTDRVESAFENPVQFKWAEGHGSNFVELINQDGPLLLGTFHVGYSDLMGFFTKHFKKRIHMLRLRQGNSEDTERLEHSAGEFLKIIWVNDANDTIYALKNTISEGGSVAMQCDRVQYASKLDKFSFLGADRYFPITIYSLAIMFEVPVLFTIAGVPDDLDGRIPVYTSDVFRPIHGTRNQNIEAAKLHFQSVLTQLEGLLQQQPEIWFNFEPLNPVEKPTY